MKMKIFNWVQRRFHQKEEDDRGNAEKVEFVKKDIATDKLALLEHVPLLNVLDGWNDGLLTIGTLGFDPLRDIGDHFEQEEEYIDEKQKYSPNDFHNEELVFVGDEDHGHDCNFEIAEEEESEMDPLMLKAFKHGFDSDFRSNTSINIDLSSDRHSKDQVGGNLEYELERKKKGERRVTLADLFAADSDTKEMLTFDGHRKDDESNINGKKTGEDYHVKKGISFSKKVIPHKKELSRPIKKLHKLMKKMLKTKIHPDLHSCKETQLGVANKEGHEGSIETLSLLQT